jgi:hypothetical protein
LIIVEPSYLEAQISVKPYSRSFNVSNQLPEDDRLLLEERLAEIAEAEWKREAVVARRIARERGLDQTVHDVRYPL